MTKCPELKQILADRPSIETVLAHTAGCPVCQKESQKGLRRLARILRASLKGGETASDSARPDTPQEPPLN